MVRLIKAVLVLAVLAMLGLVGYALLVDLAPEPQQVTIPVTLHAD